MLNLITLWNAKPASLNYIVSKQGVVDTPQMSRKIISHSINCAVKLSKQNFLKVA